MNDDTALTLPQFTIDASITEWLAQKRTTRSGSAKTNTAYGDTIQQFRDFLAGGGLDLLSNPIDIARVAPYGQVHGFLLASRTMEHPTRGIRARCPTQRIINAWLSCLPGTRSFSKCISSISLILSRTLPGVTCKPMLRYYRLSQM